MPRFRLPVAASVVLLCALVPGALALAGEEGQAEPDAAPKEGAEDLLDELSPELREVLEELGRANDDLEDVRARVTYERFIPLLDEKQKSRGSLVFRKPDRIGLKLGRPRNEEVYTNGETWWVVSHHDEQVEIYATAGKEEGSQEAAFLEFGYGAGPGKLLGDYEAELVSKEVREEEGERETLYRLKFTPRQKPDRPAKYAAIEVLLSDRRWLPHQLVLYESGGEIIHTYSLSRIRTNSGVEDDVFEYEPPRRYTVLRPAEF
ncbi:MAG: LolA family protein [Planctomycetota bacterium]|jgi:outer membrane lipoprotein-sorting protein